MTLCVEKTVLRLQITIDHPDILVQVLQGKYDLRHVESRNLLGEHALERQVVEQFATLSIFENQVQALVVLESVKELDHERVTVD